MQPSTTSLRIPTRNRPYLLAPSGCLIGFPKPIQGLAQVGTGGHFKSEPARFLHLSRPDTRIALQLRKNSRAGNLQLERQGVLRLHRASARQKSEDLILPIQSGEAEEGPRRDLRPTGNLR